YQLKTRGPEQARWDYIINVAGFLRPFSRRQPTSIRPSNSTTKTMFGNYITTAVRNVLKNKVYSLINLTGLTLGLVSSMLIFQYVIFENSADMFHNNVENIYRVNFKRVVNNGTPETISQLFLGAGEAFKEELPIVEDFIRIRADFFQEGPTLSHTRG